MAEPRPYPNTDAAEQQAMLTLMNLIDQRLVKADVRTRDKYPNVDGTLELVNDAQVPIGKVEVQVRKIGDGTKKYSCPSSLVAYSRVSTLPVIFVGVDTSTNQAFWRQIAPTMPEYKENQQSFTLRFEGTDTIDGSLTYLQRWIALIRDYQQRITEFPPLRAEVANKLKLEGLEPQDKEALQRFIEVMNNLLDNDFIAIKELLFPGVWKLGIGLTYPDKENVFYQIYSIPYGEPLPLVCKLEGVNFNSAQSNLNPLVQVLGPRDTLAKPTDKGREWVLERVARVVKGMDFSVYGEKLAGEVLLNFIDTYYRCLGIEPERDRYALGDLENVLNKYLPGICASFIMKSPTRSDGVYSLIDLDQLSSYLVDNDIKPVLLRDSTASFVISSRRCSLRAVYQSLRYLLANQVRNIDRLFARRTVLLSPGPNFIWSGYSRDDETKSVQRILESSIYEYSLLVKGNRLQLPNSPYLDSSTSIVFEYQPGGSVIFQPPRLIEYHLANTLGSLAKVLVFFKGDEGGQIDGNKFPIITMNGNQYEATFTSVSEAAFFFDRMPLLNRTYAMLRQDLSTQYGWRI